MDKIIQIISNPIGCEPSSRRSLIASALLAIKGGTVEAFEKQISSQQVPHSVYKLNEVKGSIDVCDEWELDDMNIPENSIAMFWMEGMVYPWKVFRLENKIAQANANPRIVGILIAFNSPGGMAHRVDITTDAILNSEKPVIGYVTGMSASASMWMTSACKRVFCASKTDVLGSIGVMTTYEDDSKFWEEMGIEFKDIYATLSTEKNADSRAAEEGDFTPLITKLDFYNNLFHTTIASNLKIKYDKTSPVFKGATFFAEEAITLGLAHELGSLDKALKYTLLEGMRVQSTKI